MQWIKSFTGDPLETEESLAPLWKCPVTLHVLNWGGGFWESTNSLTLPLANKWTTLRGPSQWLCNAEQKYYTIKASSFWQFLFKQAKFGKGFWDWVNFNHCPEQGTGKMGSGHLCYIAAYGRVRLKARLILEVSKEDAEVISFGMPSWVRHQAVARSKARERKVAFHKLVNNVFLHHLPSFIGRRCLVAGHFGQSGFCR